MGKELREIEATTLSDIVVRNTTIKEDELQKNVFRLEPEPTTYQDINVTNEHW